MAENDARTQKFAPVLLIIALIIAGFAFILSMQANNTAKEALHKTDTHHHSSTTSGTEVEENESDTGQPNLMRGTGQPPTQ